MTTIYKYPLRIADSQTIDLPKGHHILTVAMQGGLLIWHIFKQREF